MPSRLKVSIVTLSACFAAVLLAGALAGGDTGDEGAYRQMKVFTEVLQRIKSEYVEEPDLKSVTLGALNGLLESIDPFASYLNTDQFKLYQKQKDSAMADVGLVLAKRYGYVTIVSALPGSPAAKAGLATGDLIESIKGVATRDMPLAYAEILLKGEPGSKIGLTLLRMRSPEPQTVELTRAVVSVPLVTARMLPDGIGYIRPHTLASGKAKEVAAAIAGLEKQGAKGLVLDLRHCATGESEEGIALASLFLESGLVTYLQGQRFERKDYLADPARQITRLPLVVTTNRGTADGAEIAAAALLENKRAEVVGERTFGDAALRRPITMDDGGAIILSIAKYHSPQGKAIQDTGVVPSVPFVEAEPFLEEPEEETPERPRVPETERRPEEDNLLKKAIEVLTKSAPQTAGVVAR